MKLTIFKEQFQMISSLCECKSEEDIIVYCWGEILNSGKGIPYIGTGSVKQYIENIEFLQEKYKSEGILFIKAIEENDPLIRIKIYIDVICYYKSNYVNTRSFISLFWVYAWAKCGIIGGKEFDTISTRLEKKYYINLCPEWIVPDLWNIIAEYAIIRII